MGTLITVTLPGGRKVKATINPDRTHCRKGHELKDKNVAWHKGKSGLYYKDCKRCRAIGASVRYNTNPHDRSKRRKKVHLNNIRIREMRGSILNMFQDIKDFHVKFDLEYKGPPRHLPEDLNGFRTKFVAEELAEYVSSDKLDQRIICDAIEDILQSVGQYGGVPDLEKKLDALVDIVYVALGTAYLHGFDFEEAWRRVHAANMKKIRAAQDGSNSLRKSSNDVVKPPGWSAADLSDLVT